MDQTKIGRFIATCRKRKNLTQLQLAEKLEITDRAVSKWERGKGMPDSSIMLSLCDELGITVNELLSGEEIEMKDYKEKAEKNLVEMEKRKEETDRELLRLEYVVGYTSTLAFLATILLASLVDMVVVLRILLIVIGSIAFAVGVSTAIRLEQTAGYYECGKCHHKYVPEYNKVFFAMHFGTTRYMRCPKCNEKSWQHKVLTK